MANPPTGGPTLSFIIKQYPDGAFSALLGGALKPGDEALDGEMDAYSCGPPPMIDAVLPVLQRAGVEPERIYFDKFTPATR